jgi:hypothetical protein
MIYSIILLYILLTLVSIPFGVLFSTTNHINNVQHSTMVLNSKSIISAFLITLISACSLYYLLHVYNGTPYHAFIIGTVMTFYSEFTTSLLFQHYPLYVASINSVIGGCIFGCVTIIYNAIH